MSGSVAVASPVEGGKRGELVGGALTEEALDSSRSVLGVTRGGGQRGLQQFFTPREAAEVVQQVLDPFGRLSVLDPTAGDGALLEPWRRERRFGIEIDRDQIRAGWGGCHAPIKSRWRSRTAVDDTTAEGQAQRRQTDYESAHR